MTTKNHLITAALALVATGSFYGGERRNSRVLCEPDTGNGGGGASPPPPTDDLDTKAKALVEGAVAAAVSKALEPVRKELGDAITSLKATKATNHMDGAPGVDSPGTAKQTVTGGDQTKAPDGIGASRIIKAHMVAKMRGLSVDRVLKTWGYEAEAKAVLDAAQKAMSQNVFADGGALVPEAYSAEIIALLRNKTAVRSLGARSIPMGASLTLPKQTSAASASYVGEGIAATPSKPGVGAIRLTEKKLVGLVAVSNDLIMNASIAAEQFVRDDLVQVLALKEDYQSIFGTGGEYSPRGITALAASANQYNSTAVSQASPTLAEVKTELAKAKRKLKTNNIPMVSLGWIMSPRTEAYLYSITDGNGNSVFQAALDAGTLHGAPVVVTNQIPENLGWSVDGSADVSRVVFGDFAQFLIGESLGLEVEMFPNATYDSDGAGTIVSGISTDESVVRAKAKHDFAARYAEAFVVVSLRWGA